MKKIAPRGPFRLLQTVRAAHALSEAGYVLAIEEDDLIRFQILHRAFPDSIRVKVSNGPPVPIEIDHSLPRTKIGMLSRPLLFPHAITRECKRLWADERVYCSFRGLVTPSRQEFINEARRRLGFPSGWRRIIRRPKSDYLAVTKSRRGRTFPIKSWDAEFYRSLGATRFALCPNGDYVWSYRFFEATLCGAIPVVGDVSELYEGFHYYTLSSLTPSLKWSRTEAEENYARCQGMITATKEEIKSAVDPFLAS